MTTEQIRKKARFKYPLKDKVSARLRDAYVLGFQEATLCSLDTDFFSTAATKLRELWPTGEKDGKYPWRDSVTNLSKRLKFIWLEYDLRDKYTINDILRAGRMYLSKFQDNTRYMQLVKYFIFKQESIIQSNGEITYTYKSTLWDMLENNSDVSFAFDESTDTLENISTTLDGYIV